MAVTLLRSSGAALEGCGRAGRVARPPALGRDGCGPAQSAQTRKLSRLHHSEQAIDDVRRRAHRQLDPSFGEPLLRIRHCHHSGCSNEFQLREIEYHGLELESDRGIERGREIEGSKVLDSPVEGEYGTPFLDCGRELRTRRDRWSPTWQMHLGPHASMARVRHPPRPTDSFPEVTCEGVSGGSGDVIPSVDFRNLSGVVGRRRPSSRNPRC